MTPLKWKGGKGGAGWLSSAMLQVRAESACSESHVPWDKTFQERVDTGTPLFCPVVVASKGSSLNHSA